MNVSNVSHSYSEWKRKEWPEEGCWHPGEELHLGKDQVYFNVRYSLLCTFNFSKGWRRALSHCPLIMQIEVKSVLYLIWRPLIKLVTIFSTSLHALPGEQWNVPVSPEWEETAWWVQWPNASLSQGCLHCLPVSFSSRKHCHSQPKILLKCCVVL